MTRAFLLVVAAVSLLVAPTAAAGGACASPCKYSYSNGPCGPGSITYDFDLTPLCGTQLTATDDEMHTYATAICANSDQSCLPATWQNTYTHGVAIQFWGSKPTCGTPPACKDNEGNPACCTRDCQVLGVAPATKWGVVNPENPGTGGIYVEYTGAAASDSDPFWCTFNPTTGAQYERRVRHVFQCAPEVETVEVVSASQNSTNDCRYTITFASSYACAKLSTTISVPGDHTGKSAEALAAMGRAVSSPIPAPFFGTPAGIAMVLVACVVVGLAAGAVAYRALGRRNRSTRMVAMRPVQLL